MTQTRLEEHSSVGTAKQYRLRRRSACPIQCFRELSDCGRGAKDALDILTINDRTGSLVLETVWQMLAQTRAKLARTRHHDAMRKACMMGSFSSEEPSSTCRLLTSTR